MLCGSGKSFGHSNLGDVCEYDFHYRTWRKLSFTGTEFRPRYGQSSVLYKHKIYMFGGTFGTEFSDELFCFNLG